jgi:gamma-glutamyltranspeptidase/glutathione hydrolase
LLLVVGLAFQLPALAADGLAGGPPETVKEDINPEAATGLARRELVQAAHYMAVSANPLATRAGAAILAQGGNAVDAAIAMQMVLTLVEPQSSGIGGGAFLVMYDASAGRVRAFDGRETAPAAARGDRFMSGGKPLAFQDAVNNGRSVGVPGVLAMLEMAHRSHGRLAWQRLFAPAIDLAEQGFAVSPRPAGGSGLFL